MAEETPHPAFPPTLRTRLEQVGDPRPTSRKWETGELDYVSELGVTAVDVPELLDIVGEWLEPFDRSKGENGASGYAPVHAWRCLAHLGATEAVAPLLEMMESLDEEDDDWYLEEFPHVFAWVGPACMEALSAYMCDPAHTVYPRAAVASALSKLSKRHPQTREGVLEVLCDVLSRFQETDDALNGLLVACLLDMEATEAAEVIERAYAADCVDLLICGNWNQVREELGVEGLGLVPEHLANRRASRVEWLDPQDGRGDVGGAPVGKMTPAGRPARKVGRNDPCPCGSGKKYKRCCGA